MKNFLLLILAIITTPFYCIYLIFKSKQMKKTKVYRHGEILFKEISKLPNGLKKTKTNILMVGSHGHDHTFIGGKFYKVKEGEFVFGYFKSINTNLIHPEHSPKNGDAIIPNGNYQLIKQQEHTPQGLVPVID